MNLKAKVDYIDRDVVGLYINQLNSYIDIPMVLIGFKVDVGNIISIGINCKFISKYEKEQELLDEIGGLIKIAKPEKLRDY